MTRTSRYLFDDIFSDFDDLFRYRTLPAYVWFNSTVRSCGNLTEESGKLVYRADIPDVKKDDVSVSVEDGVLTVGCVRDDKKFSLRESVGKVTTIKATLEDGVITVTMDTPNVKKLEAKVQ